MNTLFTIIIALLMFCLLIFSHEFGHFAAAKAVKVRVNEFAVGMGPLLFSRTRGETTYSLRALPIGGYCAMEGEDEDSDDEHAFNKRPAWAKFLVVLMGPVANMVLAVILLSAISLYSGAATTTIATVTEGAPAYEAGILEGDKIIAVNGEEISTWLDCATALSSVEAGSTVDVTVIRDGEELTITSATTTNETGRTVIGIKPRVSHNLFSSLSYGVKTTKSLTFEMYDIIKQMFTGSVSVSELSGPVGIVYAVSDTVRYGMIYVVFLAALISINLAVVNLLPFPALDGGRLVFIIVRLFTGKRISDAGEAKVHFIGILLLLALMVFVTWNDIVRLAGTLAG